MNENDLFAELKKSIGCTPVRLLHTAIQESRSSIIQRFLENQFDVFIYLPDSSWFRQWERMPVEERKAEFDQVVAELRKLGDYRWVDSFNLSQNFSGFILELHVVGGVQKPLAPFVPPMSAPYDNFDDIKAVLERRVAKWLHELLVQNREHLIASFANSKRAVIPVKESDIPVNGSGISVQNEHLWQYRAQLCQMADYSWLTGLSLSGFDSMGSVETERSASLMVRRKSFE